MKTSLSDRICQIGPLVILFLIGFLLGLAYDPLVVLPEQDRCVICDGEPRTVPCLLNVDTGEIGELAGTLVPGCFQYLVCGEVVGAWDSDARTGWMTLPKSKEDVDAFFFCRPCRTLLSETVTGTYGILDLSSPEAPRVYPPAAGASYQILGYIVSVQEENEGVSLCTSLAEKLF